MLPGFIPGVKRGILEMIRDVVFLMDTWYIAVLSENNANVLNFERVSHGA